jgi:hypothetical protein
MEFTVIILLKALQLHAGLCRVDSLLIEFLRFWNYRFKWRWRELLGYIKEIATVFRESRNNDRLPWNTTFDLGIVQHQITIAGNKFEIRADIVF